MAEDHYNKQVNLLLELLPIVEEMGCFSLRGGTAINLFIREMPRLSVDIDLTYKFIKERKESLEEISSSLNLAAEIAKKRLSKITLRKNVLGPEGRTHKLFVYREGINVKIEPNEIFRGTVYESSKIELSRSVSEKYNFFTEVTCNSRADIYGSKICAALDRQHPRDLFDVKILFENEGLSKNIKDAFIVYLCGSGRPLEEFLNPNLLDIKDAFENQFIGMSFVPVTVEELERVRDRLISELVGKLTSPEREFLYSLSSGAPEWDLVDLPNHIQELPAIKWKLINIQKMSPKKKKESLEKLKRVLEL